MSFPHRSPLSFSVGPVRRLPYLSALDGLRAIAVIAVMIYHADERWLQGGYLGVEVFFTISGYLITALLITEYERTGRIDLMAFWKRRANRLLPALGVLLAGVAVLALFTARDALVSLGGQAVAALAYVMNWSLIATQQSYFESFGRPPLLQHLWSLAVEEQFYLAFPILFFLGRRLIGRRAFLAVVSIGVGCQRSRCGVVLIQPSTHPGCTTGPTRVPRDCLWGWHWPWSGVLGPPQVAARFAPPPCPTWSASWAWACWSANSCCLVRMTPGCTTAAS